MARLFEIENDRIEKQNQVKGFITSMVIHGIMIVLFFFLAGIKPPIPPWDSGGVEINFGYMDDGMGSVQPVATESTPVLPQALNPEVSKTDQGEKIISQDNSDEIVAVKKKGDIKKKNNQTVTNTEKETKTEDKKTEPKAVFKGWTNTNSTSEGNGNKPGDKGQLNGTPGGNAYSGNPGVNGGPGGDGIGYNLGNRKMTKRPSLKNNSQETGVVVISIKVNKQGKVIYAEGPVKGSTTTSGLLIKLAKEASFAAQFDVDSNAMDEQFGTITFNFKAR